MVDLASRGGEGLDLALERGYDLMILDVMLSAADRPGLSFFYCHMQPDMDFRFMGLFNYVCAWRFPQATSRRSAQSIRKPWAHGCLIWLEHAVVPSPGRS